MEDINAFPSPQLFQESLGELKGQAGIALKGITFQRNVCNARGGLIPTLPRPPPPPLWPSRCSPQGKSGPVDTILWDPEEKVLVSERWLIPSLCFALGS